MLHKLRQLPQRVHLVGIGGGGMSGLANCLLALKHTVSGSELQASRETKRLSELGATIFYDHSPDNVKQAELIVASDAISPYNPELEAARRIDISVLRRAECLDLLCAPKTSVFVAGSHGKSTTSGMIAKVLEIAGSEPSFVIGDIVPSLGKQRARIGRGVHFVAEACEAFQNLGCYNPDIAVITNLDDDHLEHYGDQETLDQAFLDFAARAETAIVNGNDVGIRRILAKLSIPALKFGAQPHSDVSASSYVHHDAGSRFEVSIRGTSAGLITLQIPGAHNVENALACIATCHVLGVPFDRIAGGLAAFTGVSRRWEDYGVINGVRIIDDYAHHPRELEEVIRTARSKLGNGGRLLIGFQPQLYSRTQRLYRDFARVLSDCDHVFLLEIDPSGEHNSGAVRSTLILDEIRKRGGFVQDLVDVDELIEQAPRIVRDGDLLLLAGAGSIRNAAREIHRHLVADAAKTSSLRLQSKQYFSLPGFWRSMTSRRRLVREPTATVISLFRTQALRFPMKQAISDDTTAISYRDLDKISEALAGVFRARGVVRGSPVGVYLPVSIDLVAIMLGLMKVGAVYLPLDESLPVERVRYMLTKANARLLIAPRGAAYGPKLGTWEILDEGDLQTALDQLASRTRTSNSGKLLAEPAEGDAAYICFTSGSTGHPKGVIIRHKALYRLIAEIVPRFQVNSETRTVVNTSIGFDVSLAELLGTLCGGGELIVSGSRKPLVGKRLGRLLVEAQITHLFVTPSVLASVGHITLPALSCIVCAGEACPQELVDTWAEGRHFFNAYGPTEATIYATTAQCHSGTKVTIGKALNHVTTHVLDNDLKPALREEPGELYLGGCGVAEGYIDFDEETQRKFFDLAREGLPNNRIYRTGDLVKQDADGNLSFLGRVDNQIKILGNRIELEEIEHSIQRLAGIADVTVCIDEIAGANELICFVVMGPRQSFDKNAIRERLSTWLPSYMLPSRFERVDAIPLTTSGKKDRRSLLSKLHVRAARRNAFVGPMNEIEEKLADIWKNVLEVEYEVGRNDDFASLGGDSLRSLMLIEEVEQKFGIATPPAYFGRISTIYRMAVQLADLLWTDPNDSKSGSEFRSSRIYKQLRDLTVGWAGARVNESSLISSLGEQEAIYDLFLCVQEENEFVSLARHIGRSFRLHCLRSGHLVMDYTEKNVERLTEHYIEEIEQIKPKGRLVVAGICQGGMIAHALANKLRDCGKDVVMLVHIEQPRPLPFDGNVAFIYANESPYNPQHQGGFGKYDTVLGNRYSVDFVPGEHWAACMEPNVQFLAAKLRNRLSLLTT